MLEQVANLSQSLIRRQALYERHWQDCQPEVVHDIEGVVYQKATWWFGDKECWQSQ